MSGDAIGYVLQNVKRKNGVEAGISKRQILTDTKHVCALIVDYLVIDHVGVVFAVAACATKVCIRVLLPE